MRPAFEIVQAAMSAMDGSLGSMNATTLLPDEILNDTCVCYPVYQDGSMYNRAIAMYLSQCLYTVRDYISFAVGMSSIVFWILCQMPQLISNCRTKSVVALSVWFLLQWMAGDLMNLVGCYLTGQLLTQKATAMLYLVMDSIVIFQYLYYAKCRKACHKDDEASGDSDADGDEALVDPVRDAESPAHSTYVAFNELSVVQSGLQMRR